METHVHADFVFGARQLVNEVPSATFLASLDAREIDRDDYFERRKYLEWR